MIKTYIAGTVISLSVRTTETTSKRIVFDALSNGKSTFTTNDKELQEAIEKHSRFNQLFRLASIVEEKKDKPKDVSKEATKGAEILEGVALVEEAGEQTPEVKTLSFPDWGAVKEYLATEYGITRTSLKSQKAMRDLATSKGIELDVKA